MAPRATFSEMITAAGVSRGDRETAAAARRRAGTQTAPRVIQIAARDPEEIALAARHAADVGRGLDRHQHGLSLQAGHRRPRRLRADARSRPGQPADRRGRERGRRSRERQNAARLGSTPRATRRNWRAARRPRARSSSPCTAARASSFITARADWAAIAAVKDAVRIPVVANGDCDSPHAAREMLRLSGADAVMVGRAAHRPPLARRRHRPLSRRPGGFARRRPARSAARWRCEHFEGLIAAMGAGAGLRHARKHLAAYVDHAGVAKADEEGAALRRALVVSDESARGAPADRTPVLQSAEREDAA